MASVIDLHGYAVGRTTDCNRQGCERMSTGAFAVQAVEGGEVSLLLCTDCAAEVTPADSPAQQRMFEEG